MSDSKISLDSVVLRSPEHVFSDIDGEVVLLGIETGHYYGFDAVLSEIWGMMEAPVAVSALVDRLLERYEVERAVCEADVLKIFNRMLDDKLIEIE